MIVRRKEVLPFTDNQISMMETFADQAFIAIENARLFEEVQARTTELGEALEQQTTSSEVLGIVSRYGPRVCHRQADRGDARWAHLGRVDCG
jgi:GAF domain-containing protein